MLGPRAEGPEASYGAPARDPEEVARRRCRGAARLAFRLRGWAALVVVHGGGAGTPAAPTADASTGLSKGRVAPASSTGDALTSSEAPTEAEPKEKSAELLSAGLGFDTVGASRDDLRRLAELSLAYAETQGFDDACLDLPGIEGLRRLRAALAADDGTWWRDGGDATEPSEAAAPSRTAPSDEVLRTAPPSDRGSLVDSFRGCALIRVDARTAPRTARRLLGSERRPLPAMFLLKGASVVDVGSRFLEVSRAVWASEQPGDDAMTRALFERETAKAAVRALSRRRLACAAARVAACLCDAAPAEIAFWASSARPPPPARRVFPKRGGGTLKLLRFFDPYPPPDS